MNGIGALTDSAGHLAGRPLEEWNAAYEKVENYFHALRVRNKALLGRLVLRVLERAAQPRARRAGTLRHPARRRGNGSHCD